MTLVCAFLVAGTASPAAAHAPAPASSDLPCLESPIVVELPPEVMDASSERVRSGTAEPRPRALGPLGELLLFLSPRECDTPG
ncbi:hypothetical protein SAMN02745673_04800 [Marinactinospora thermotolerans DSM 45154]|uniref:Uncharacterized protein n=1 Tax=Marinactinospora thermotolerans DSM 45154 TaxID=1122192 RepID=A0A1T4TCW6_9ACTN|nr:hypothetical protein SAMN02745673_04800 [Marinactinospora thermotolerans DSM 45154]